MRKSYGGYRLKQDEPAVALAAAALARCGLEVRYGLSGGGADANVFNERGRRCVNLSHGVSDFHTPDEQVAVADLEAMVDVTVALVEAHERELRAGLGATRLRGALLGLTVERWGDHEREIVEHPGAVAIVAVDEEGYVALVRQLREPARERLLELPAGTAEPGEEPARDGAAGAPRGVRADRRRVARAGRVLDDARLLPRADAPVRRGGSRSRRGRARRGRGARARPLAGRGDPRRGSARSRTRRHSPACCSISRRPDRRERPTTKPSPGTPTQGGEAVPPPSRRR